MKRIGKIWKVRRTPKNDALQPNRRRERPSDSTKKGDPTGEKTDSRGDKPGIKILSAVSRIFASTVLTAASLWAGYAAYEHAITSDYFAVTEFHVAGHKRLKKQEVLETAGIGAGDNVFRVDISQAENRLVDHPWVLSAKVKRRLPRGLEVDLTERIVAATVLFDVPYLVDDEGDVFKRWGPGDPNASPMITGFSREDFNKDPNGVKEVIRDALSFADRYRAAGLAKRTPLDEVHRELDGSFSLAIGGDPVYVRLGKGPYRRKLRRLRILLSKLRRDGKRPAMIFFDNEVRPDRATVRMKTEPTPDPSFGMSISDPASGQSNNFQKLMSKI